MTGGGRVKGGSKGLGLWGEAALSSCIWTPPVLQAVRQQNKKMRAYIRSLIG